MYNEQRVPVSPDEPEQADKHSVKIEPTPITSLTAEFQRGEQEFRAVLRGADIRSLVRYIEKAGVDIGDLAELPDSLRKRFATTEFKKQPYAWRNPKLYLVPRRTVVDLALGDILRRNP